jgi:coenzyme F420-reducing hydrogenase gamma subunit
MAHYHNERDAFEEYQNRCTRNMPHEGSETWIQTKASKVDIANMVKETEERIDSIGKDTPTTGEHYMNKYQRKLNSFIMKHVGENEVEIVIDVYDVLDAYPSGCPPIDHAIKKLLCTGSRGLKDWETDLQEAIDSLERAKSFPPVPF